MLHLLEHCLIETLLSVPYLFIAYLLIEWLTHRAKGALKNGLKRFGPLSSSAGALSGLVPQCGFSVIAAGLYADRLITPGTLLAVFIATSDEAIPILLSRPDAGAALIKLMSVKLLLAIAVGLITDMLLRPLWIKRWQNSTELTHIHAEDDHHHHDSTTCSHSRCHGRIWQIALRHTIETALLIFIVTAIFHLGLDMLGKEKTERLLMSGNILQPVIAALFGLIPSCASSVILTDLYLKGAISFGSVIAGLTTGAGTGTLILLKVCHSKREALLILAILFVIGSLAGIIIS